jgi:putative hydrolase of the HAD superfamily
MLRGAIMNIQTTSTTADVGVAGADAAQGRSAALQPDWDAIDTVLLDLDGTLLNLAYDTHFWRQVVPRAYAAANGITEQAAAQRLQPLFRSHEGTLGWYCVEFWSDQLGLDVAALKRGSEGVEWLPGAREYLGLLRRRGKRLVLLTNAHPVTLAIKDERAGVSRHMDAMYSSHVFGAPKEDPAFWAGVRGAEPFDPARSLIADDSPAVLAAARQAGIRWVYGMRRPDSLGTVRDHGRHPAVDVLQDLG